MNARPLLAPLLAATFCLAAAPAEAQTLLDARRGHATQVAAKKREGGRLGKPDPKSFQLVLYPTKLGPMQAYLSKPQRPGQKQPAIIWITGGFPAGGIGKAAWEPLPSRNEQSANAYRRAGLIMMYPTFRGVAGNPGHQEFFYGEVEDVIAAANYLAKRPEVDRHRIFLGGHSTGGTLALLAATTGHRFRGVICFGPAEGGSSYGEALPPELRTGREAALRNAIDFLSAIRVPTLVIEGASGRIASLEALAARSKNPLLSFFKVPGAGHFDVLAPLNDLIAEKISKLAAVSKLELSDAEVQAVYKHYDFEAGKRGDTGRARPGQTPKQTQRPPRPKRKDAGAANGPGWHVKLNEALAIAQRSKRPVLALFTCSDRGASSKALHEVLASEEFQTWADESLVLLEVDFPVRKRQSPKLKLQNVRLKSDCEVRKLPEVVFLGGDGQVLGRVPKAKGGAKAWLEAAQAALAKAR